MAHRLPMSGHLGRDKTAQRILRRFFWPSIFKDVKDYCRGCPECQMTSPRGGNRAPLMPLPIIEEPFSRIAMDVVGPLPKTVQGHRFILVVCDYSTRYPEAIPLRRVTAPVVAEQLVELFSRHGIPREILTDQGTNFTSSLLQELYKMLGVTSLRTTPYHPQTDGLVERFNKTLKQMLRRLITGEGREWHKLLPYILFAYREVPQVSTGFSPFELLYGRDPRGPLDILREGWVRSNPKGDDVISYVQKVYDRMEAARDAVKENLEAAQRRQKAWYDKRARETQLEVGEEVLVLLPTRSEKLLSKWKGPFKITRRVGKVNYQIEIPGPTMKQKLFHINIIKKWHPPADLYYHAVTDDPDDELDVEWRNQNSTATLTVGAKLSPQSRKQLEDLLKLYPKLLEEKPGRTGLIEHTIPLNNSRPIRQSPYRIPAAYRDEVEKELTEMLEHGMIEPTVSPWASPMVVVRKKDGTARICVDYRRLNSVTDMDAYPLPRIEDILDSIGRAKFITTLYLAKGYWQVPVSPGDRAKTAFVSPLGLYQFTTMPFGLCGAPSTFQRLMDDVLRGQQSFARAYLDDIVIFSCDWEEHLAHLRAVFEELREAGLTIKLRKCQFAMEECSYLGHKIGGGVVQPEQNKVEAIRQYPRPLTKKNVRAFLGLAGYYRRFISRFAELARPLTDLTRKQQPDPVQWTPACEEAFIALKKALEDPPVLHNPDFNQPFILQTDASDLAVGAVLSQKGADGLEHPVSYFSRKLLPRETRYATVEKECLAVKLSIERFCIYLTGRRFTVQTDHSALRWLDRMKDQNARLTRWSLALQPYQFDIQHRAGRKNVNADSLSRIAVDQCFALQKEGGMWPSETLSDSIKSIKSIKSQQLEDVDKRSPPNPTPDPCTYTLSDCLETDQLIRSPASAPCYATD